MNWDQVAGSWNQIQGKFQEEWGRLTQDDMATAGGRRDQLVGFLQERYGWIKEEAERKLDEFVNKL